MSCTLDLSSVITCEKATTSGIFSIGVGYCDVGKVHVHVSSNNEIFLKTYVLFVENTRMIILQLSIKYFKYHMKFRG